jgi:hypothetical protein
LQFSSQNNTIPLTFSVVAGSLVVTQLPTLTSANVWVGNSSNAATAVSISGDASLSNAGALTVNSVGTSSASNIHAAEVLANAATNSNTASAIVKRDGSGNFTAGTITATTIITTSNIGIGTSSPTNSGGYTTVSIAGSTGGQIAFQTGTTPKGYIYSDGSGNLSMSSTSSGSLGFMGNTGVSTGGDYEFYSERARGEGTMVDEE